MQMLEVQGTKSIEQTSWKLVESEHTGPDSQCLPGFIMPSACANADNAFISLWDARAAE